MANTFHGCTVSVTCKNGVGVYQGLVSEVNGQSQMIILTKPFKNGLPCDERQVALSAHMIEDITILEKAITSNISMPNTSTVTVSKPIPKRAHQPVSENIPHLKPGSNSNNSTNKQFIKPPANNESPRKTQTVADTFQSALFVDSSKKNPRHKWTERDEACFGEPINPHYFKKEFDFEKNLALFNKQAVFDKIKAQHKPDLLRRTDKPPQRACKVDEISSRFRQILVPQSRIKEYVTDEGLTVPSISSSLRDQLFSKAQDMDLVFSRMAELMGRATTEIAIPLLGGAHRLNPLSNQQKPLVVALAGPHRPGAMAINAARQLATQGVDTIVLLTHPTIFDPCVAPELNLYRYTGHNVTDNVYELPPSGVDLVVLGLADEHTQKVNRLITTWATDCKSVLVAVDPPHRGTPNITVRFSLVPALPLAHSQDNGQLFLVNVALPLKVFSDLNIRYRSPFGPKFVIPLHLKE